MLSAEFWVAISFVCFVVLFGKKIYALLSREADNYILDIKTKIKEAEKLREEASDLLKSAYERKNNVKNEVERYKRDSEMYINSLKLEDKKYLDQLEKNMLKTFEADIKSSLSKKSEQMINSLTNKFSEGLLNKIASEQPKIEVRVSDLDRLKK